MNGKKLNDEVLVAKNAITDDKIVKALEYCESREGCIGGVCPLYSGENTDCVKIAIDLIHRLHAEKKELKSIAEYQQNSNIERFAIIQKKDKENAELQEQATKNYNNGFDRGVKAAVEKIRAYLPPRDEDLYPDALPQHWQLDEVLRQLIGNK